MKKRYASKIHGPQAWDKIVSAAYQISLGAKREDAANIVGVDRRTLYNWERGPFWEKALAEAHRRWCSGIISSTKNAIAEALGDPQEYAGMARFVAERMIVELRAPKQRMDVDALVVATEANDLTDEQLLKIAQRGTQDKKPLVEATVIPTPPEEVK
ncbi:MAG: hypothetical protein A2Y75_01600 [Candidatus Solincola sediminis]|uniref:Homeodomain phBC6A51-type domain-containing protein n=1 Tax=Candidatus Solincola sediminis TaxID=1797199 RepID=A0A1F2WNJ5_9ACTN|nr:MAG: hypothetical protein A2Y75_01600 [Candidatus Solincola sediminis]